MVSQPMPQEETKLRGGRIVRSESPLNLEMPSKTWRTSSEKALTTSLSPL
jgi:hypothetical protein